jgi:hypothetical protein
VDIGPTIIGVYYGNYPKNTSGRCGRYNHAEYGGKTDCGFNGAHAVLGVGHRLHYGYVNGKKVILHRDFLVRDPDHHSAARPEHPNFDRISSTQLNRTVQALAPNTPFSNSYIIYPTLRK